MRLRPASPRGGRHLGWLVGVALPLAPAAAAQDGDGAAFFEARIRPVLVARCFECHSARAKELGANLRLDSRAALLRGGDSGPAVEPGRPDDSLLIRAIEHSSEVALMPPGGRLPESVIADFRAWVAQGLPGLADAPP